MAKNSPQDEKNKRFFSSKLNELLSLNNKKQVDLHRDLNIPKSTITGYVKGTSLPTMGNLQKIADYFNVLTSDIDLRFKKANDSDDDGLQLSMLNKFNRLTLPRKRKVVDYADTQLKDQWRKENIHSINEMQRTYTVDVLGAVSAGTGEWLDEEQHNHVAVSEQPPVYDFAVQVNGDSMEPMFADEQIIYVKRVEGTEEVRDNQIVIAELNSSSYVKKIVFVNDRKNCQLISLNKEYQPIDVTEDDELKVIGLVVI